MYRLCFATSQPKHEVFRKLPGIAFDLFIQPLRRYSVEVREIGIQEDTLTAQHEDAALDTLNWQESVSGHE